MACLVGLRFAIWIIKNHSSSLLAYPPCPYQIHHEQAVTIIQAPATSSPLVLQPKKLGVSLRQFASPIIAR
ncbi:hypothetical protein VTN00DRAFT_7303 [Thermoascus crustaceus]|uniref:uncharacterized protein n=1 Tax=Thermoascus crustaceus TaxID=5088 RepID=UPI0037437383